METLGEEVQILVSERVADLNNQPLLHNLNLQHQHKSHHQFQNIPHHNYNHNINHLQVNLNQPINPNHQTSPNHPKNLHTNHTSTNPGHLSSHHLFHQQLHLMTLMTILVTPTTPTIHQENNYTRVHHISLHHILKTQLLNLHMEKYTQTLPQ